MCLQGLCARKLLVYLVGSVCGCVQNSNYTCTFRLIRYMMMSWLCQEPMTEHVAVSLTLSVRIALHNFRILLTIRGVIQYLIASFSVL